MRIIFSTFCIVFFTTQLFAQEELIPQPSPNAVVTLKYEDTYVKVTYSRPQKRGRQIFGYLVPYGKVWRTGANEATEITITDTILVAGDTLNAGTYSIYTIPDKEKWTIIFNNELGQWGAYNYLESSDALRVEVPVEKIKDVIWEPFTIQFESHNQTADLLMLWDRTRVRIPIEFIE